MFRIKRHPGESFSHAVSLGTLRARVGGHGGGYATWLPKGPLLQARGSTSQMPVSLEETRCGDRSIQADSPGPGRRQDTVGAQTEVRNGHQGDARGDG